MSSSTQADTNATPVVAAGGAQDAASAAATDQPKPGTAKPAQHEPVLNVTWVNRALKGHWAGERDAARELAARPELQHVPGLGMDEHRARVLSQLSILVEEGAVHRAFPTDLGGQENHGGNIAAFEELVLADPSLQIKAGVQWGLFGAAVLHLGTKAHHDRLLPDIMNLSIPGAFAMTEIGHGSDVASIATTASYDPDTEEFVVHTPFKAAWKEFLGNAALHGRAAVVFAQLITKGVNHGVHAFYMPIRDDEGQFLPGIGGEDDGLKGGLNGIDNGRLHFDQVRIPRENLLNRYGDVAADGSYTSPIASPGRRFFTMVGTLVQGRVSLDGASVIASALALDIAIRYGTQRRQFTGGGEHEEVILDYQRHQRRLLPLLATTYASYFAHEKLLVAFDGVFSGEHDSDEDREDLETLAAALKPMSTWHALHTLQEAREACGGAGYMSDNRLVHLRPDLDIYATFEGDNNVLLQLVAKRLLTDYSRQFASMGPGAMMQFVGDKIGDNLINRSGLRQFTQGIFDFGSTARAVDQLKNTEAQRALLTDRVHTMVAEIADRLKDARKLGPEDAAALFNANQNELIEAAQAHAELLQWEAFTEALDTVPDEDTRQILTWLRDLFGFGLLEKHIAWYLINGRMASQRARSVSQYIDRLLPRIRRHALDLVDAFGFERAHVRARIATGVEQQRQEEAMAYYREKREAGELPVEEKTLYKQAKN